MLYIGVANSCLKAQVAMQRGHWAGCLRGAAPSALGAAERVAGSSELSEEAGNLNFSSHSKILIFGNYF